MRGAKYRCSGHPAIALLKKLIRNEKKLPGLLAKFPATRYNMCGKIYIDKRDVTMKSRTLNFLRIYVFLTLGTALLAVGIYFFKFPNNFSTGGVSGMSVILSHYFPSLSPATFVSIINYLLLIIGFIVFGRAFGIRTAFCTIVLSGMLQLLEIICPMSAPMTTQPLLELFFAVGLPAVGSAILFNLDASSGGTDIVAMIFKKYTNLNIGNALFAADALIALLACAAFGMETGLFSVLGLFLKSMLVDVVMDNFHMKKCMQIITVNPDPIVDYIIQTLHRGATINRVEGAYSHEEKYIILTVLSRIQALHVRKYVHTVDPHAFTVITSSTEIIGKGFMQD